MPSDLTPELRKPLNPQDRDMPITVDFSKVLNGDAGETIASVVSVVAQPDGMPVGSSPRVVDGKRPQCAVQFTLSPAAVGNYVVTSTILTSTGVQLGRPIIVPVREF